MNILSCDHLSENGNFVNKFLFGHNLEHTRSAVFQGLSAQLLKNRKFAGKPAAHSGEAAEWYRIGPENVFISLDPAESYVCNFGEKKDGLFNFSNAKNSQIIQNPYDGQTAGIGQKGISLRGNEQYRAAVVLKGRGETIPDVIISIISSSKKLLAENTFPVTSRDWSRFEFIFSVEKDIENVSFEITLKKRAELKIGSASLLPLDTFHGMRKDVVALMKDLGISLLRWPGGNFSGEYRWKDGLLPVDMRPPVFSYQPIETNPHSGGYDFHEIGIDEFIALCREINAEPYITVNLGMDSPRESAEWVEYCNGGPDSEYGKKRAERGYPESFNVKYWSLGNEFGFGHMEGLNTPEEYAEKALATAAEMKKIDPGLVLFASGPFSPGIDPEPWATTMLPLLAREVKYVSYHAYVWQMMHDVDFVTTKGMEETYHAVINTPRQWLEKLRELRLLLNKGGEDLQKISIAFDEWNVFFAWYHNPGIIDGIFTALMLEMVVKESHPLNMPVCMYFQPVNEGAITIYPLNSELTSNGQVFSLMKKHRGGLLVDVKSSEQNIFSLGTIDQNERKLIITLVNSDYENPYVFECDPNLPVAEKGELLDGSASILPGTKFNISNVEIQNAYNIPPHSILQLEFQLP